MFEDFVKPFQIDLGEVLSSLLLNLDRIIIWGESGYSSVLFYIGLMEDKDKMVTKI